MTCTVLFAGGGTGGHVFPLVAVAEALSALAPDVRSVFVGTEHGLEAEVVPARGFELELVRVDPIRGRGITGGVRGAFRAAMALPEARSLVQKHAPRAVLSIGGYAAGPLSLAARAMGVPLALIEPNAVMGLTNRLVCPLVHRGYIAFSEVGRHFRSGRALESGVPLRKGFEPQAPKSGSDRRSVLVLGGSQGARALNELVPSALAALRVPVRVVHQVGAGRSDAVRSAYAGLGGASVVEFIDDMPRALADADVVVGRAGASAVAEICAVGRPSLLVPFPFASGGHQLANARSLERAGAAACVEEADATPERLAQELERLLAFPEALREMADRARALGRPGAAATIARDLSMLAGLERVSPAPPKVA